MKSSVAGVLDSYGGLFVVVTEAWRMPVFARPGSYVVVVPGLKVQEPVPWDLIPWVIRQVEQYVDRWIEERNDPDIRNSDAVKLYRLRQLRTYHREVVHLPDIVET